MHNLLSPSGMADWLSTWGYLGLFICVFIGNLGIPVPEETVLLTAGFLAGRNSLDLRTLYAVGIASAVTGDCAGFLFGRTGGQRLFERNSHRNFSTYADTTTVCRYSFRRMAIRRSS
jgi:membrane protein DedA with SNARE-associated domain